MSKNLVVKTNRLNQAFQMLTLAELHIVQLAIVDARETGTGLSTNKPLRIDAMRYAEAFNTTRQNAYQRMKSAEDTLFNRRFSYFDDEGKLVKSRWIQQVRYLDDEGAIELVFTMAVVDGISRIDGVQEFFTQYLIGQTANLTSVYSARLYELLIQWKSIGKTPIFELNNFRDQLGIGINEYQRMDHFKIRVLDMALKEINEHTDITASYEQHKKGRLITGFSFKFKQKKKTEVETPKNSDLSDSKQKTVEIPANLVKQPENSNLSDLDKRVRAITGAIAKNNLASRFQHGNESPLEMMKRIQSEITSDDIADTWQNKLETMGVVF
ncbi:replication initiation protein RepM [Streptomyces sp. LaBMicrA B280]|uniref:replication initiation protein RepM n=1 Tax=Streptomyces sp. LaBMicrA B280 TaxID=3391001 RepID=UPI003BA50530